MMTMACLEFDAIWGGMSSNRECDGDGVVTCCRERHAKSLLAKWRSIGFNHDQGAFYAE